MRNKALQWIDSTLLGSAITLNRANRIVRDKINGCNQSQFEKDERLKHSIEDLHAMLNVSIQRVERVENKAMSTLLGVAVAIAVFGSTSRLLGADGVLEHSSLVIRIAAALLLVVAMLYLVGSGLLALESYKIGHVFRPTLSDRAPVTKENREKMATLYAIEQNQRAATLRSNRLSSSFACLRNGLLAVVLLGALSVAAGFPSKPQNVPEYSGSTF